MNATKLNRKSWIRHESIGTLCLASIRMHSAYCTLLWLKRSFYFVAFLLSIFFARSGQRDSFIWQLMYSGVFFSSSSNRGSMALKQYCNQNVSCCVYDRSFTPKIEINCSNSFLMRASILIRWFSIINNATLILCMLSVDCHSASNNGRTQKEKSIEIIYWSLLVTV